MIYPATPTDKRKGATGRKVTLIRLKERLRHAPLMKLFNSPKTPHKHLSWLLKAKMNGTVDETGEYLDIEVAYKYGSEVNFGRWYASYPSMQNCPGYIRRLCSFGLYVDIDIKNAFPTILVQLAEQAGLQAPLLRAYVDHREDCINSVCAELGVSFKQVKNAVLIAMHGGNYKQAVENQCCQKLTDFAAEVEQLAYDARRTVWSSQTQRSCFVATTLRRRGTRRDSADGAR
jgi:hypothetical protein